MFAFAKAFLAGSPWDKRLPESPPLNAAQEYALAVLENKFDQHSLRLSRNRGDILFLNNLSILHARESFSDDPSIGMSRHLLSMMLRDAPRAWRQPFELFKYSELRFSRTAARAMVTLDQFDAHLRSLELGGVPGPKAHD